MESLSNEILLIIFSNLHLNDLLNCGLVSSDFNKIVNDNSLWKQIGMTDFGECYQKLLTDNSLQTYRLCYQLSKLKEQL